MFNFITRVKNAVAALFTKRKKIVSLPGRGEEYDGWLGV